MIFGGSGGSGESGGAPRARRGRLSWPSVTHTLPSRSTNIPCGKIIVPEPKLFTSAPVALNFRMGSSFESRHELVPHRSPTQIDVPSLSTATALVEPHVRPSGILKWFSIVRNG